MLVPAARPDAITTHILHRHLIRSIFFLLLLLLLLLWVWYERCRGTGPS